MPFCKMDVNLWMLFFEIITPTISCTILKWLGFGLFNFIFFSLNYWKVMDKLGFCIFKHRWLLFHPLFLLTPYKPILFVLVLPLKSYENEAKRDVPIFIDLCQRCVSPLHCIIYIFYMLICTFASLKCIMQSIIFC